MISIPIIDRIINMQQLGSINKVNNEIQSLRAIAIVIILIGHMPIVLPDFLLHGYTFVSLFLVFTGYFATVQFNKKYSQTYSKWTVLKCEFIAKFFRLFPLMWTWILIYFLIGNLTIHFGGSYVNMNRWVPELKSALLLYYNYYLAGLDIGGAFGQYWTLFVEIHFHVLFIICFLFIKKDKSRIIISIILIIFTVFVFRPLTPVKMVRYSTQAQLDPLFAGVLIGLINNRFTDKNCKKQLPFFLKRFIGLLLIVSLFISGYFFDRYLNNGNIKYTVYTFISVVILLLAIKNEGYFSYGKIVDAILKWIGDCSASIYVSHVILFSCLYYNIYTYTGILPDTVKGTVWGVVLQVILLIVLSCFIGRISYLLLEKPFVKYARTINSRS